PVPPLPRGDGNDVSRVSPAGSTRTGQGPAYTPGTPGHRSGDSRRAHGSVPIRQAVQALHRRDALGLSGGSTPLVRGRANVSQQAPRPPVLRCGRMFAATTPGESQIVVVTALVPGIFRRNRRREGEEDTSRSRSAAMFCPGERCRDVEWDVSEGEAIGV